MGKRCLSHVDQHRAGAGRRRQPLRRRSACVMSTSGSLLITCCMTCRWVSMRAKWSSCAGHPDRAKASSPRIDSVRGDRRFGRIHHPVATRFDEAEVSGGDGVPVLHLYPHKTVLENVILAPMKVKGLARHEAQKIAMSLLTRVRVPEKAAVISPIRPEVSSNVWPSPAHLQCGRRSCCSTNRPLRSTPK